MQEKEELTAQQKKDIFSMAANSITRKPVTIEIDIKPHSWLDRLLMRIQLKKKVVKFELRPLLVGNRYRIGARSIHIADDILTVAMSKSLFDISYIEDLIYIVAVGIQNDKNEPSKSLLRFIRFQFDDTDIFKVLDAVLAQIDLSSFTKSIILIKGSNVLNVPELDAKSVEEAA